MLAATRADLGDLAWFESAVNGGSAWRRTLAWGVPWALIATAVLGLRPNARAIDPAATIGDASYALYLIHPCVLLAAERLHGTLTLSLGTHALTVVAMSVGSALAFRRWVERPLLAQHGPATLSGRQPAPA